MTVCVLQTPSTARGTTSKGKRKKVSVRGERERTYWVGKKFGGFMACLLTKIEE